MSPQSPSSCVLLRLPQSTASKADVDLLRRIVSVHIHPSQHGETIRQATYPENTETLYIPGFHEVPKSHKLTEGKPGDTGRE